MNQLKYLALLVRHTFDFPSLIEDGRHIRDTVPVLEEAKNPKGLHDGSSKETRRVVFLGESTLAGVGVETHADGFAGSFAKRWSQMTDESIQWEVKARSGYTAKRVIQKLVNKIEMKEADLVVIGLGGNDAFKLASPRKWRRDISSLIKRVRLRFPEVPIVFTNMPPVRLFPAFSPLTKEIIGSLVSLLGLQLKETISPLDGVYFNAEEITIEAWSERMNLDANIDQYFSDGVHPSPLTYQIWGRDLAEFAATQIYRKT